MLLIYITLKSLKEKINRCETLFDFYNLDCSNLVWFITLPQAFIGELHALICHLDTFFRENFLTEVKNYNPRAP